MGWDLNRYETEFKKSPTRVIRKVVIWIFLLGIVFSAVSYALGWFSESATVAKDEFGAKASLKKYDKIALLRCRCTKRRSNLAGSDPCG